MPFRGRLEKLSVRDDSGQVSSCDSRRLVEPDVILLPFIALCLGSYIILCINRVIQNYPIHTFYVSINMDTVSFPFYQ